MLDRQTLISIISSLPDKSLIDMLSQQGVHVSQGELGVNNAGAGKEPGPSTWNQREIKLAQDKRPTIADYTYLRREDAPVDYATSLKRGEQHGEPDSDDYLIEQLTADENSGGE